MTSAVFRTHGNIPIEKDIDIRKMRGNFILKQFKYLCRYAMWTKRLVWIQVQMMLEISFLLVGDKRMSLRNFSCIHKNVYVNNLH